MRKILFFVAFATLAIFVSCQKDDLNKDYTVKDPVFTATIENSGTKTTVDAVNAKVSWVEGDEITITDASSTSVKYVVSNIDAQGKATFTKDPNETKTLGDGPYTAIYGTAPATVQTYSTSAPSLPMLASSSTTSLNFRVTCGLLEITLTKSGEVIKFIDVSDGTNTYTLVCPNVSITDATKFYIAVPGATYTSFIFTNPSNKACVKSGLSIAVEVNHIKPVSSNNLNFDVDKYRGKFTVNGAGKQVYFSSGNLYYNGNSWDFEANQYDYRTYQGSYSCINGNISTDGTPENHWGLFGWSTDGDGATTGYKKWGINTSTGDKEKGEDPKDYAGTFVNWGENTISGYPTNTWCTLSKDEWNYLINREQTNKFAKAMVKGVIGLLIFPDGYNGTTLVSGTGIAEVNDDCASFPESDIPDATWSSMESAGCVFLPCAGCRYGSDISGLFNGGYWSSTDFTDEPDMYRAYFFLFGDDYVEPGDNSRYIGYSVRLVKDIK